MIHYALKCSKDHRFESWFQSAGAFDKLKAANLVNCSVCGTSEVDRDLMAPRVWAGKPAKTPAPAPLSAPASPAEQAMAEFKAQVEQNSDYVGRDFAREARAMHIGETAFRPIYGDAPPQEARALVEEGIPITPLPFRIGPKSN